MSVSTHARDHWPEIVVLVLLAVATYYTVSLWQVYFEVEVWRHDAVYYYNTYLPKLLSEGRWVNYYLFDYLKLLNPYLSASLHAIFLGSFLLIAAVKVCRSVSYAVMIALVCIASATTYIQLLWPVTTLPSFALLALAALVHTRLPAYLFYALFGILLFGSMSYLYFFLPLLFITDYLKPGISIGQRTKAFILRLLIPWIAGYVAGYLAAIGMVYFETGQAGIALAQWREPTPVTGLHSLFTNILRAGQYFALDTLEYFRMLGWTLAMLTLALFAYSYYKRQQYFHLLLPLLVMLALYASTIPYGINLSFRTSAGIWFGLVFIFLVIPDIGRMEKPVYTLVALLILVLTSAYSRINLVWYKDTTNYYLSELLAVTPGEPQDYQGIIFLSSLKKYPDLEQRINAQLGLGPTVGILTMATAPRWTAIAKQAGFSTVQLCTAAPERKLCIQAEEVIAQSTLSSPGSLYRSGSSEEGWLVVKLNDDYPVP